MKGITAEYFKLSDEDKVNYLNKLRAKQEFAKIKEKLDMGQGDSKVESLKREMKEIEMQKSSKQKVKSFSIIQNMVQKELTFQMQQINKE